VGQHERRPPPRARLRFPGRGRPRDRGRDLAPEHEPAAPPELHACPVPVEAEVAEPGLPGELVPLPAARPPGDDDEPTLESVFASAEKFLTLFYTENQLGAPDRRLWRVRREIGATGTYWHTGAELAFGARIAWRNSARCIGRLYWRSLKLRDRRYTSAARDVATESVAHLREATNGGRIRPTITVFAPDTPDQPGPRILNSQLVRYAGYQAAGGAVLGDPANSDLTRLAWELGWPGGRPAGRFDLLPLIVQEAGGPLTVHEVPPGAVLEVPLAHPEFPWFARLGLRWYAVPVISPPRRSTAGTCAPRSGRATSGTVTATTSCR
jgi:nitric-oxide synthase, bacterial